MTEKALQTPLDETKVATLRAGDVVLLSGTVYTARDAAHRRLLAAVQSGQPLPLPLDGQVIYYVGPAPAKAGQVVGPAGPTTSGRMDPYTIPLLERGLKGLIGKGYRSLEIKEALVRYRAVYLAAVGGAAALLARQITGSQTIAYPDLGPEAIRALQIVDFPLIVVNDCFGGDAYEAGRARFAKR